MWARGYIIITLAVVLGGATGRAVAAAADSPVITLSCDGKMRTASNDQGEPIHKMGFVVNQRTVALNGYTVGITGVNADILSFGGTITSQGIAVSIFGTVDRVTGALQATQVSSVLSVAYELDCKPAARMF